MQTFAFKVGFSLYYELTKKVLPKTGGVVARWFSNVERLDGTFPQSVFEHLLPPTTLRQGKFEVSDQFAYQWRLAENERMAMFLATFRHSFAVLAFAAVDKGLFDVETKHPFRILRARRTDCFSKEREPAAMTTTPQRSPSARCAPPACVMS